MDWLDEGFVLDRRAHGETAAIVSLLTLEHGRHAGLVHGGAGASARRACCRSVTACASPGARGWQSTSARSKPKWCRAASATSSRTPAAWRRCNRRWRWCSWPCPSANRTPNCSTPSRRCRRRWRGMPGRRLMYFWEFRFLQSLGFSIDLAACAVTGQSEDLAYVSPRSGRAVSSRGAGEYRDKLLKLPAFLIGGPYGGEQDLVDGLRPHRLFHRTPYHVDLQRRATAGAG